MRKKYIIVGDNNFWYSTTSEITETELKTEINDVWQRINNNEYSEAESLATPRELRAFATTQSLIFGNDQK